MPATVPSSSALSRRRVLAGSAWAAPAIAIATAVPAAAQNSADLPQDGDLVVDSLQDWVVESDVATGTLRISTSTVRNSSPTVTYSQVQFTLTLPSNEATTTYLQTAGSHWNVVATESGATVIYTLTYIGDIPPNGSVSGGAIDITRPDSAPPGGSFDVVGVGTAGTATAAVHMPGGGHYTYGTPPE
ncbi:hypothetical protein [Demequina sp. NBRC 110056]|uniref:hypothetical protein n=1 Tax=Demequina sp. NBRC 110056 TaxID=1570345 RepID=UPI000A0454D5|nr:hypothetical protein [Demequina sp. NBRC 110056]